MIKVIGIYDCFGYGVSYDVSFEERYKLIKNAGFDCVMLWWSDKFGRGNGYQEDVQFARNAGLFVENIHTPERKTYFDAKTKLHLINYIESRADNNNALFVSLNKQHKRLTESGVELRHRGMGKKLGVEKVHPHKFRRAMATKAIEKGMSIE